ncbi:MAG: nucleoside 2-deoxyribosyltransferase [Flavobacteriaceae bacterium]
MKKAYFAISYSNRNQFDIEVESLKKLFSKYNIKLLVFVDIYDFKSTEEKEMMQTAFDEIDSSDFLIAELTTKSIGVGIEIGYAVAKNKPIFYLRKTTAEYSTTAAGCASYTIEYNNEIDLVIMMEKMLKTH